MPRHDAFTRWGRFQRFLAASLNCFPAAKAGALVSGMISASPVFGLRPARSLRVLSSNVPNPGKATFSPVTTVSTMPSKVAFNANAASFLESPDFSATRSASSFFPMQRTCRAPTRPGLNRPDLDAVFFPRSTCTYPSAPCQFEFRVQRAFLPSSMLVRPRADPFLSVDRGRSPLRWRCNAQHAWLLPSRGRRVPQIPTKVRKNGANGVAQWPPQRASMLTSDRAERFERGWASQQKRKRRPDRKGKGRGFETGETRGTWMPYHRNGGDGPVCSGFPRTNVEDGKGNGLPSSG